MLQLNPKVEGFQVYYIGVDVDSENLVCQRRLEGKPHSLKIFPNTATGFRAFIRKATQRQCTARVCMEATGVYSLPFALALHAAAGIEVAVANPKTIKKFAEARLQGGKTDAMDADTITEFLVRMPFSPWQPPEEEILELQHITRRIIQWNGELSRERNRHEAAKCLGRIRRVVTHDTQINMRHIQRRIDSLEEETLALIHSIPELDAQMKIITSIKDIADKTGSRILAELATLPPDMKANQWVA